MCPMTDGLTVGHINARLDAIFDDAGFDRFDRRYDDANIKSRHPLQAKLGADFDPRALDAYDQALERARAKASRRDHFKAQLGADYQPAAFREYERALDASRAKAAKPVRAELTADFDGRGIEAYNEALDRAERRARRRDAFAAHLGGEVDDNAFREFEKTLDDIENAAGSAGAALGGSGGNGGLRGNVAGLTGPMGRLVGVAIALSPALEAVAGAALAVAGSLAEAAAGAGAVGTGAAAALGPIGAVAFMASQRVGLLENAYKALDAQETKGAVTAAASADARRSAAERIAGAEETLQSAHLATVRTEDELSDARDRAAREIEDLRLASERAVVSEQRSQISLDETLQRLAEVEADPASTQLQIRAARAAVAEARQAVEEAHISRRRAAEDEAKGTDTVRQAKERVADADRAEERAAQGVRRAREAATEATKNQGGAAIAADQALSKLDDTERHLLETFRRVREDATDSFRPATDALFSGVDDALTEVEPLLHRYKADFTDIGTTIGNVSREAGRSLQSGPWRHALDEIVSTSKRIVRPIADAVGSAAETARNVAVASLPFVEELADDVEGFFDDLADGTSDTHKLRVEIGHLWDQTKRWADLLWDVGDLLVTVLGGGADEGADLVDELDHMVERWDKFLETDEGRAKLGEWFHRQVDHAKDIAHFLDGVWHGVRTVAGVLGHVSGFFATIAANLTGVGKEADGYERMGIALGGLAALKFTGLTGMLGRLLGVAREGGTLAKLFEKLPGLSRLTGGPLGSVISQRGASPANPMYVVDISGGRGVPVGVSGKVAAGAEAAGGAAAGGAGLRGALTRWAPRVLRGAGWAGAALTANDLLGNPIGGALSPRLKITDLAAELDRFAAPGGGDKSQSRLKDLVRDLHAADKASDPKRLRAVADEIDRLGNSLGGLNGKGLRAVAEDVRRLAADKGFEQVRGEVDRSAKQFAIMATSTDGHLSDIRASVKINMERISGSLGKKSDEGRAALAANFKQAAAAVQQAMDDGKISAKTGLAEIDRLMSKALAQYGFDRSQRRNLLAGHRYDGGANEGSAQNIIHYAVGGIPNPGAGARDDHIVLDPAGRPIAAISGSEGIVNTPQMGVIDTALSIAKNVAGLPWGSLNELWGSGMRHYAQGGGLGKAVARANQLERAHLPYVYGGHHGDRGPITNPRPGLDCSSAVSYVLGIPPRVSGQFESYGRPGEGPITIYANPEHVLMRIGRRFFGTSRTNPDGGPGWIDPAPSASYLSRFTVRHVDGAGGGLPGDIRAPRATGVHGALRRVVQGALNVVTRGANASLSARLASLDDPAGQPLRDAHGRFSVNEMARLWTRADGPPSESHTAGAVGAAESDGKPNAVGPPTRWGRAKGLWQILGQVVPGNIFDPAVNARNAVRKWRDARGWSPWEAYTNGRFRQFLNTGGLLRRFNGGGQLAAAAPKPVPIRALMHRAKSAGRRGVGEYDRLLDDVKVLDRHYGQRDREYNLTEEVLVDEETGQVDHDAVNRRLIELWSLLSIRQQIVAKLRRAQAVVKRTIRTIRDVIGRLSGVKGRRRAKAQRDIAALRDQIDGDDGWAAKLRDLGLDLTDSNLDVQETSKEMSAVGGTRPRPPESTDPPAFDPTGDMQALVAQAQARAEAATQNLAVAQANLAAFTGPGDLGTGGYANAFAAATSTAPVGAGPVPGMAGPPSADLSTPAGQQAFAAAGGRVIVVQSQSLVPGSNVDRQRISDAVTAALDMQPRREPEKVLVG